MSNRWLRFGIAFLALAAAAAATYRCFQQEQSFTTHAATARGIDALAETALVTVAEIESALHAYVAEGQGHAFWTARTATLVDQLRKTLLDLDGPATSANAPLAEALDQVDRLATIDRRAQEHVRVGQRLLAGELIFIDARDRLDALRVQIAASREAIRTAHDQSGAAIRRTQALLGLGAGGVLAFAVLLLAVPAREAAAVAIPVKTSSSTAVAEPPDEFESSARLISRTPLKPAAAATPAPAASTLTPAATAVAAAGGTRSPAAAPPTPVARTTPSTATTPAAAQPAAKPAHSFTVSITEAATICTELGRASQSIEVTKLLDRASKVLNAHGAVVWVVSADGRELVPAASAGYDERLLARIGPIARTANNVTASAVRAGTPRTSARVGQTPAALAVPLLTPLGAVGVLSAEIRTVAEIDDTRLAVARIFAAQLANIVAAKAAGAGASTKAPEQDEAARAR